MSKNRVTVDELEKTIFDDGGDHPLNFSRTQETKKTSGPLGSDVLPMPEQRRSTPSQRQTRTQPAPQSNAVPQQQPAIQKPVENITENVEVVEQQETSKPKYYDPEEFDTRIGLYLTEEQKTYIDQAARTLQKLRTRKDFRHTNNSFLRAVIDVVREQLQFQEGDTADDFEETKALLRTRLFGE